MWPFKKKPPNQPDIVEKVPESVKPPDIVIDLILTENFSGNIARQWVNWASEQLGEQPKYFIGYPMTPRSVWVLYEGCRVYVEGTKNEPKSN